MAGDGDLFLDGVAEKADLNNTTSRKRSFDKRWLLYFGLFIIVISLAIFLNINHYHSNENIADIANLMDIDNGDQNHNKNMIRNLHDL